MSLRQSRPRRRALAPSTALLTTGESTKYLRERIGRLPELGLDQAAGTVFNPPLLYFHVNPHFTDRDIAAVESSINVAVCLSLQEMVRGLINKAIDFRIPLSEARLRVSGDLAELERDIARTTPIDCHPEEFFVLNEKDLSLGPELLKKVQDRLQRMGEYACLERKAA